jgi:peptidoglycan/xylan/chitin deacetylase (PgdA/CDA1 family)
MALGKKTIKEIVGMSFLKMLEVFSLFRNTRLILMYHRVARDLPEEIHDPAMYVTSRTLAMHIQEISTYFDIVSLESCMSSKAGKRGLCAITFDDGWADNYEVAFPVLRKLGVPATIFLPVDMIGSRQGFWFENLQYLAAKMCRQDRRDDFVHYFSSRVPAWIRKGIHHEHLNELVVRLKGLPAPMIDMIVLQAFEIHGIEPPAGGHAMNWEQVREMGAHGITFGSHGLHHYILPRVTSGVKYAEISRSWTTLQQTRVPAAPFFSYPNGDWDEECLSLVKEAGYRGAVTTQIGTNNTSSDLYLLKRTGLHEEISNTPALLWFRLLQAMVG